MPNIVSYRLGQDNGLSGLVNGHTRQNIDRGVWRVAGNYFQAGYNAGSVAEQGMETLALTVILVGLFPYIGGYGHAVRGFYSSGWVLFE